MPAMLEFLGKEMDGLERADPSQILWRLVVGPLVALIAHVPIRRIFYSLLFLFIVAWISYLALSQWITKVPWPDRQARAVVA